MAVWRFNTDESELAGRNAADRMVLRSCVAAWGEKIDPLALLSRPEVGDVVFFYQDKVGVIAMATFDDSAPYSSYEIFHKQREMEFSRKVVGLIDRRTHPITPNQIKEATGATFPARQTLVQLHNPSVIEFLTNAFAR